MFVIKCPYSENCYRVASTRVRSTASPGPTAISFADTNVCQETAIVILVELCHVSIHYIEVTLYHVTIHYIPVVQHHVTIHYIPVAQHHVTISHIIVLLRITFHVREHSISTVTSQGRRTSMTTPHLLHNNFAAN